MPASIPVLKKSPFAIDPRPLSEMSSSHAALLATSRALRSLNLGGLAEANLHLKRRHSGFTEAQMLESLILLQPLGGDCPEDTSLLHESDCLSRGLGYTPPKTRTVHEFLERFHDEDLAALRPPRHEQKSWFLAVFSGRQEFVDCLR